MLEPAHARIHLRSTGRLDVVETAKEIQRKIRDVQAIGTGRGSFRVHTPEGYGRAMQTRPRDPRFIRWQDVIHVEILDE